MLGIPAAALIFGAAPFIGEHFFQSSDMTEPVRILALILPIGGASACFKGWCNAVCRVSVAAFCDVLEFLIRMAVLGIYLTNASYVSAHSICMAVAISMAAGNVVSLVFLLWDFSRHRIKSSQAPTKSFHQYLRFAVPVFLGGCLTSALSTANDALIPFTLRQYGNSTESALSQFGIFEAIVIPVLFFPSTVLCVLSGILLPEAARAKAGGKKTRLQYLTGRALSFTMMFSVFISAVLLVLGGEIAELMGAEPLAGRMICFLAPVVPFIYLEIVLEAIIKGSGNQKFSSMNYLFEYAVRISAVLVLIPLIGFYGIVASYYASNIVGNCMRLCKIFQITEMNFDIKGLVLRPLFTAASAFFLPFTAMKLTGIHPADSIVSAVIYLISAVLIYLGTASLTMSSDYNIRKRKRKCTAQVVK